MSFEELLKNLQKDYIASLPNKISDIRGQIRKNSPVDLRESFHKLKGTGRTYGLPEISELAEAVEYVCANKPNDAVKAAQQAASILEDILVARKAQNQYTLATDPRFQKINQMRNI